MSDYDFKTSGNTTKQVIITEFNQHRNKVFEEKVYVPELNDFLNFTALVYPSGKGEQNVNHVSCMIGITLLKFSRFIFACTVSIIDAFGCLRRPRSFGSNFVEVTSRRIEIGLERYVSRMEILNDSSGLMKNNTLTLQFELVYNTVVRRSTMNIGAEWYTRPLEDEIQDEHKSLVVETNDGAFISLLFNERETNRFTAVSDIFFQICDAIDSSRDKLVLTNVNEVTFNHFIGYIKNAKVDIKTIADACDLYTMSRHYSVLNLPRDVTAYMRDNLNLQNIAEISLLACRYDDEQLMLGISKYWARVSLNLKNKPMYFVIIREIEKCLFNRFKENILYKKLIKNDSKKEENPIQLKVDKLENITLDYIDNYIIFINSSKQIWSLYEISRRYEINNILPSFREIFRQNLRIENINLLFDYARSKKDLSLMILIAEFEKKNGVVDGKADKALKNYEENLHETNIEFNNQQSDEGISTVELPIFDFDQFDSYK